MTDATHGLPIHGEADPTFGRSYAVRGEFTPDLHLAGWVVIVPAVLLGIAGWVALFMAVIL